MHKPSSRLPCHESSFFILRRSDANHLTITEMSYSFAAYGCQQRCFRCIIHVLQDANDKQYSLRLPGALFSLAVCSGAGAYDLQPVHSYSFIYSFYSVAGSMTIQSYTELKTHCLFSYFIAIFEHFFGFYWLNHAVARQRYMSVMYRKINMFRSRIVATPCVFREHLSWWHVVLWHASSAVLCVFDIYSAANRRLRGPASVRPATSDRSRPPRG